VSVVLRAAGRPEPVRRALEALCHQALPRSAFEVVVISDGVEDATRDAAQAFERRLSVRFDAQRGAGVASARNRGVLLAAGEIVLFLDDREVPDPGLLLAHREAHRSRPELEVAILGRTRLSEALARDPLMHFATRTGCFLHSYPYVKDGDVLDFRFLWPDRCSVKRAVLTERGLFDPRFRRGDDHAELGFRLGLRVVHVAHALTTLEDGYDFDGFCGWLRDQGSSSYLFARLHPERVVQEATAVAAARAAWRRCVLAMDAVLRSARSLDRTVRMSMAGGLEVTGEEVALLHRSYWAAFSGSRLMGMAEQAAEVGEPFTSAVEPASPGERTRPAASPELPSVSVVIPVHDQVAYTRRCLEALEQSAPGGLYEVIVVDDASTDETAGFLRTQAPRVRALRNEVNTGFVGACNRGAAAARGEWILFLNNDTEPRPGWLEALLRLTETESDVGAVGAQLVYGNGTLQEAGGIVFRDGSGWNFGRGDAPGRPAYQRACEVDYCSGAALMVRRDLFERLGGFDPRYAPAYYEDTDLCFGVRSLGYKVWYCPASVVTHFEGISNGTDTSGGLKRYQVVNREKFVAKWREALARHEPSPVLSGRTPVTADRPCRLVEALLDRDSPALRWTALG
jgi:GT2 family glycosyltransferase